ncbi:MAG: 50S ribosomal protein L10 [Planctomycetota bacterium]
MSKAVKALMTEQLRERYAGMSSACVVELTGLDVQAQEKLRRNLRGKSARLEVVKNSLARRAFRGGPLDPLGAALTGPCAVVTSSGSLIDVAKLLVEAAKEFKKLKLKQGVLDGDPMLLSVEAISRMRGRLEILGELAMLLSSPGRAVAGCLQSPQAKIAGCLKAMIDKAA